MSLEVFEIVNGTEDSKLWRKAVMLLTEKKRTEMLEAKLAYYAEKYGLYVDASAIAGLLGRTLTEKELETIIEKRISNRTTHSFEKELMPAIRSLPKNKRTEWLEKALDLFVSEGDLNESKAIAKELGIELSVDHLQNMIDKWSNPFNPFMRRPIILEFPEPKRTEELKSMLQARIKNGDSLEDCVQLANDLGRKLTVREIRVLLKSYVESGSVYGSEQAVKLLKRKLSEKELRRILRKCIQDKYYSGAISVAKHFPKDRRSGLLRPLLDVALADANIGEAQSVAKAMKHKLSYSEIEGVLIKQAKKSHHRDSYLRYLAEAMLASC